MKSPEQWLMQLCTSHHDVACVCPHCKHGVERLLLASDITAIQEDATDPGDEANEMMQKHIEEHEALQKSLRDRIQNYLGNGGLFNPELMEHDKVRDLLMACRDYLS